MKIKSLILYLSGLAIMASCVEDLQEDLPTTYDDSQIIHVGGAVTESMSVSVDPITRAVDADGHERAESLSWLQGALRTGLDITYANINSAGNHNTDKERVAILKWTGDTQTGSDGIKRGIYTFNYKGTGIGSEGQDGYIPAEPALWYDNGPHYFEGQYVPTAIRKASGATTITAQNLKTEQYDASEVSAEVTMDGNYTLLSHYIGMPPNWTTSATVDQILLPFKHRLSRVIAYVLIDPMLETTLKGYKGASHTDTNDDPTTTDLRFCNVKVLDYVEESSITIGVGDDAKQTTKLTPKWGQGRKVIPHYIKETSTSLTLDGADPYTVEGETTKNQNAITAVSEAFIVYTRLKDNKKLHPGEKDWATAHHLFYAGTAAQKAQYTQKKYFKVPIYDIIVRPTYSTTDQVMYDEEGYYTTSGGTKVVNTSTVNTLFSQKNSIDFELTLESGLQYSKHFEFDLDANKQTIVYLAVDQAGVNYDATESQTWDETLGNDYYYGVNNDLGHNLSKAGSSWQRAIRNKSYNPGVTDGNDYGAIENSVYVGQYVDDATWIAALKEAHAGGSHHGDYFVLENDITIDASTWPTNFVFTGHLDGRGKTITLINVPTGDDATTPYLFTGLNALYTTAQENAPSPNAKDQDGNYTVQWEANVHKENNGKDFWVPVAGYRAEIMNVTLQGGTFFPTSGTTYNESSTLYDYNSTAPTTEVSGYIYNCYEGTTPVCHIVPIPEYK